MMRNPRRLCLRGFCGSGNRVVTEMEEKDEITVSNYSEVDGWFGFLFPLRCGVGGPVFHHNTSGFLLILALCFRRDKI